MKDEVYCRNGFFIRSQRKQKIHESFYAVMELKKIDLCLFKSFNLSSA